jgi:glutathione S-transferase
MLTFYYSPRSCSIGIRVLLEEAGAAFEAVEISLAKRAQFSDDYGAVNPKRKVPALVREDGALVTEFQTIALWIGRAFPAAGLIPPDAEGELRMMEALDFIVGSVHMRGFTFVIVPAKFTSIPEAQEELRAHGRGQVEAGLARLAETLGDKDWLMGRFSLADAALFYLTCWATQLGLAMPPAIAAHHERMKARPAVQRALAGEGIAA